MGTYWLQRVVPNNVAACGRVDGPFNDPSSLYRWIYCNDLGAIMSVGHQSNIPWEQPSHGAEIHQNELITYMQCGATRLQQLVDLFGQMVQDKSGDPTTRMQRIDALADIIRNQIQELQTIATPQGGAR